MKITIDKSLVSNRMVDSHYHRYKAMGANLMKSLSDKTCAGNDFLGWIDLPAQTDQAFLDEINETANKLRSNSDVVVVIGIGGSYLGARAVIESQKNPFDHNGCEVVYAGHQLSPGYLTELAAYLSTKKWSIISISKSGTTTEPALAFRHLRTALVDQFGESAMTERVVAITDASKGALRQLADAKGMKTFVIPDDVGGRFSVFTPVGLLPIAVAGFDIKGLIAGAKEMQTEIWSKTDNIALEYAALRNTLLQNGHTTEVLANYHHKFHYIAEWWKQLFGESEGKGGKGIFPASVDFTTDLHSMGQYIQDGNRNLFETVVKFENGQLKPEKISNDDENLDKLNYLADKDFGFVNNNAMEATMLAHNSGGVPNILLKLQDDGIETIGSLLYFFMATCAISGLMLQVNPFDQPGVEDYKTNMFALLEKPGFEAQLEEIKKLRQKLNF
ncbi:MAG: glucose-6-phosphate isomerase [Salinivirgaceae bacterium]